jgi:hypothetical protein
VTTTKHLSKKSRDSALEKVTREFRSLLVHLQAGDTPDPLRFEVTRTDGELRVKEATGFSTYRLSHEKAATVAIAEAGFDPYAAGLEAMTKLQGAEGGSWSGQELLSKFNLTSATLHKRRKEHRVVFWRDAQHQFHYPKWQFTVTGALLPGVQEVLQTFRSFDEWRIMRYFLAQRSQLGDRTPLDLLRAGEVEGVLAHAQAHAEENSW